MTSLNRALLALCVLIVPLLCHGQKVAGAGSNTSLSLGDVLSELCTLQPNLTICPSSLRDSRMLTAEMLLATDPETRKTPPGSTPCDEPPATCKLFRAGSFKGLSWNVVLTYYGPGKRKIAKVRAAKGKKITPVNFRLGYGLKDVTAITITVDGKRKYHINKAASLLPGRSRIRLPGKTKKGRKTRGPKGKH